ncbi:hypothetical protein PLEOSDRAFT_163919 [Pleurotus ostreatus PC15]|uniref:Uncharacterized protein n=1 Tax=Pleurotus ostreatus (strain PC15) TaxID=1137138 RepID=A0A067P209_PLEO1|nr:hypothetical protein PLEOSDRAFT_163919 [Pleurotus ostreatus PC15]
MPVPLSRSAAGNVAIVTCGLSQQLPSEALRLAEAIGGAQEEKAQIKAEKRHQESRPNRTRRVQASTAKVKLKETKALIAARQAQIKKHKAKQRKQAKDGALSEIAPPTTPSTKKKVSFA